MADNKRFAPGENPADLKGADASKSFGTPNQNPMTEAVGVKMGEVIGSSSGRKKRGKKLPVILDVIVGVLMLAAVVGLAVGAYYLFRYYTDDYEGLDIEYTLICVSEDASTINYRAMRNKGVFLDTEDNTLYFGEVVSADLYSLDDESGEEMLVLVIRASVKYKADEGYTIGDRRIAVGSEYTLRTERLVIEGTVVELAESAQKAAEKSAETQGEGGN